MLSGFWKGSTRTTEINEPPGILTFLGFSLLFIYPQKLLLTTITSPTQWENIEECCFASPPGVAERITHLGHPLTHCSGFPRLILVNQQPQPIGFVLEMFFLASHRESDVLDEVARHILVLTLEVFVGRGAVDSSGRWGWCVTVNAPLVWSRACKHWDSD